MTSRPHHPILAEILVGDDGDLPCDPPDDCGVCVLLTDPLDGESRVEHGRRLLALMLRSEYRRLCGAS